MSEAKVRVVGQPDKIEEKTFDAFKTMYVLLGGTGMKVGMRLRRRVLEAHGIPQLPFQQYLWLDTDKQDQRSQTIDETEAVARRLELPDDDIIDISLPFERVRHVRDHMHEYPWLQEWLDLDMLRDLGQSARAEDGAAQIRALGRLAFTEKFQEFRAKFQHRFDELSKGSLPSEAQEYKYKVESRAIEIAIICSLGGGTGAGCFIEAARVMRELAAARSQGAVHIKAYLLLPGVYRRRLSDKPAAWEEVQANACAALMELNSLSALTHEGFRAPPVWIEDFKVENPVGDPFNQVFLLEERNDAGQTLEGDFDEDAFSMLADALYFDFERSAFGGKMRSHRCNVMPHLQSTSYLSYPVNDGTQAAVKDGELGNRKYVFRFPNAFGAFGLARVPFERQRLRRAAASWLAAEMLNLLVDEPETDITRAQVEEVIVRPELERAELSLDQILTRILQSGEGDGTFDEIAARRFSERLEPLRKRVEAQFAAGGVGADERLERLERADDFARSLTDEVGKLLAEARKEVKSLLSDRGAREDFGKHLLAIEDVQNTILRDFKERLNEFTFGLLGRPKTHGYVVADAACGIVSDQLGALLKSSPAVDAAPEVGALEFTMSPRLRRAVERRASAEALWLPVYGSLARGYFRRENARLLGDTSTDYARAARSYVAGASAAFAAWVKAEYRAVAGKHSTELFEKLRAFVGKKVDVREDAGDEGGTLAIPEGLRGQLHEYREAVHSSVSFFRAMHESYSKRRLSSRNAADLTPYDGLQKGVEDALTGNELRGPGYTRKGLLEEQWSAFFTENGFLSEGDTEPMRGGIRELKERAVARQVRDRTKWDSFQATLEEWTYRQLEKRGYLSEQDAIVLLNQSGTATEQLKHAARGAHPWLRFDQSRARVETLQPIGLVGARSTQAGFLADWKKGSDGAFSSTKTQVIENESGSVILYAEKMVFPLYSVAAVSELYEQYKRVQRKGKHALSRRHTTKHHLELPPILPPKDPNEANRWFGIARLALEASLLGVFEKEGRGSVKYEYENDEDGVRRTIVFPAMLGAIAKVLRLQEPLRLSIEEAVSNRLTELFDDPTAAYEALRLAHWTQNDAFGDTGYEYLEHELAKSVFQRWREVGIRRSGHVRAEQLTAIRGLDVVPFTKVAPIGSWALRRECDGLRSLSSGPAVGGAASPGVW